MFSGDLKLLFKEEMRRRSFCLSSLMYNLNVEEGKTQLSSSNMEQGLVEKLQFLFQTIKCHLLCGTEDGAQQHMVILSLW